MKLDAIGIIAENPLKTIAFYSKLGLEFESFGEGDHFEAKTSSGVRIMVDSVNLVRKLRPSWKSSEQGKVALAFLCETPQEVDEHYQTLVSSGSHGECAPWDAFWGQRYASILDPDGNCVDLFCPLS